MIERPNWTEYFLRMCDLVSLRSTCLRRAVGSVIVRGNRILASGYNGAVSGAQHCSELGCLREQLKVPSGERHELCRGAHGEMNAIIQCALHGVSTEGATLFSTTFPCSICAKMIVNSGIKHIIVSHDYPDDMAKEIFKNANVKVEVYEINNNKT